MSTSERARLVDELVRQSRASTMWTVLTHHAAASRSGVNVTDMQCVNLLQLEGPLTPGQIAERMSLTTGGAITAVIDRLERAGLVRRHRDDEDRRRVIVKLVEDGALAGLAKGFEPVAEAYGKLLAGYSDDELRVILDFTVRRNRLGPEIIRRMRELS